MQRYFNREGTPLKFHNFIRFFSLPVGLLFMLKQLFWDTLPYIHSNKFYYLILGYSLIVVALFIITFIGFLRWRAYAWYSWMTCLVMAPIINLVLIVIYAMYLPDEMTTIIIQFITSFLYSILVSVYYRKRKPLFFPSEENAGTIENHPYSDSEVLSGSVEKAEPADDKALCAQCHAELLHPGGAFCPNCGHGIGKNDDMTEGL